MVCQGRQLSVGILIFHVRYGSQGDLQTMITRIHVRRLSVLAVIGISSVFLTSYAQSQTPPQKPGNWPGWRGPNRDGISTESQWMASLPKEGPKQLWKFSLGPGCASVSVSLCRVYAMGNKKDFDIVYCIDPETGIDLWKHTYQCPLDPDSFEGGPAATPTVDAKRVYTLSRQGHLFCLDALSGDVKWSYEAQKEWGANRPGWGFSGSPLVEKDLLIVNADLVLSLDKRTGEVIWRTDPLGADYSSPVAFDLGEKRCLAIFCTKGLVILNVEDGAELCSLPWKTAWDVNATTPIIEGDKIFVSSGYKVGGGVIQVAEANAHLVWENKNMRNHFNSCVLWKENLYGFDETTLTSMNFATGSVNWSQDGLGKGSLTLADGKLIILSEQGELVITQASRQGYKEVSRAQVLDGRCWVVPVLANGRLYCKNNQGTLVCLDLRKPDQTSDNDL